MPAIEYATLPQPAVLWRKAGFSDVGQFTVGPPLEIMTDWNDSQRETLDKDGNTIVVDATASVGVDVPVGSIIWKGAMDDLPGTGLVPEKGIMEVKSSNSTPDVKGRNVGRTIGMVRYKDELPTVITSIDP